MTATGIFSTISRTVALTAVLVAGAAGVAQAADSNDRILPPNPADIAMLRSLLALQHPSLRQGAAPTATTAAPTAGSETTQQSSQQS